MKNFIPDLESPSPLMTDRYQRRINYLRISITDRCNLKCAYCIPSGSAEKLAHADVLRYEEILRIAAVGAGLGINKVRVTGGEPLVRKGVGEFLEQLGRVKGIKDVSLTTNGVLLRQYLDLLGEAGIKRLNISLDTLDPRKYKSLTGMDAFSRVWDGILAAHKAGFYPIKLNCVALMGFNDSELVELARLSFHFPFHIRFIEYMPIGDHCLPKSCFMHAAHIKARLETLGRLVPIARERYDGPAERYRLEGACGEIGLIRPMSHHFCATCNRLRLTADGRLRVCLLSDLHQDLRTPLRRGLSDRELAALLRGAVDLKPRGHGFQASAETHVAGNMSQIGG